MSARRGSVPPPAAKSATPAPGNDRNRKRTTINDIARMAAVSKKTVSRVINKSPYVREATRVKVKAIIAKGSRPILKRAGWLSGVRSCLGSSTTIRTHNTSSTSSKAFSIARVGIRVVVHPCKRNSASFLDDLRSFVERQKLFGVLLIPPVSENGDLAQLLTDVDCP